MGFLADFVKDKITREHAARMNQYEGWKLLSSDERATPETKEWAMGQLIGHPDAKKGMKDGSAVQGLFGQLKGLIGLRDKNGGSDSLDLRTPPFVPGPVGSPPPPGFGQPQPPAPTEGRPAPGAHLASPPDLVGQDLVDYVSSMPSTGDKRFFMSPVEQANQAAKVTDIKERAAIPAAVEKERAMIGPATEKAEALWPIEVKRMVEIERQKGELDWSMLQKKLEYINSAPTESERYDRAEQTITGYTRPSNAMPSIAIQQMQDWMAQNPGKGPADYGDYVASRTDERAIRNQEAIAGRQQNTFEQQNAMQARMFEQQNSLAEQRLAAQQDRTKIPTPTERAALRSFERMFEATRRLRDLDESMSGLSLAEQTRMRLAPNFMQTQLGQDANNAERTFVEALLRRESGATIRPDEYAAVGGTYFVRPGDTPASIADKRRRREIALSAIMRESGRAYAEAYGEAPVAPMQGGPGSTIETGGDKPSGAGAAPAAATAAGPTATLNGRTIVVRGGKWVYQDTGEEAK